MEPAITTSNNMEHGATPGDADAPRRTELWPEVNAASKAHTSKDIIEQKLATSVRFGFHFLVLLGREQPAI